MKISLKNTPRFLTVFLALILGLTFVYLISTISRSSEGPIGTLFNKTAAFIRGVEEEMILKKRVGLRSEKLKWFTAFRDVKDDVVNSKIILLGASDNTQIDSYEKIIDLEDSLRVTFPIIHIYKAWGGKREHEFPTIEAEAIYKLGSIPMITWEPWVGAFSVDDFPKIEPSLEKRDKGSLAAIARGDYDTYVVKWALEAKKFNHLIYLRLGHEMNDPYHYPWGPQNNYPEDFVRAWQYIYKIFTKNNVDNIVWVWNPHLSYDFKSYYPGDEYVDVISFGILNFGTSISWSKWWTFDELFSNNYKPLTDFNKPMMISEFGSLSVGGDRAEWFRHAIQTIPADYPEIKSIVFFHYSNETSTDKNLNWYFIDDTTVTRAIHEQLTQWPDSLKPGN
jgi:beta-mannanase